MALVWIIAVVLIMVLFGSMLVRAARWVVQMLGAMALAIILGIGAAAVLTKGDSEIGALALLLSATFLLPILWLVGRIGPVRPFQYVTSPQPIAAKPARPKRALFRRELVSSPFEQAWDRLSQEAPDQLARIGVARRSCERLRIELRKRHFDLEAHRSLIMIDEHLPGIITNSLNQAVSHAVLPRPRVIDELVDLVERFAADCERQLTSACQREAVDNDLLRQHIENYLARDQLKPVGD